MTTLPTASAIPGSLLEYDQWVCWREETRGEKLTKIPVNPHTGRYASVTNEETWGSFETARDYAVDGAAEGLGFVFCDDDPFVGVDLDDARDSDTGTPTPWAESIIENLRSYTEVSPSNTGYHILVEGELPPGRNRRGDVELYETARFFTVTAAHVEATPTEIRERTRELFAVYANHVGDEDESTDREEDTTVDADHRRTETASGTSDESPLSTETLSDEELLSRARAASNSAKFEQLWRGDTHGYDSQSEADMALACLLAFWTGGEANQMDRLFRRSGLMREKWDTVHYADGSTYGETTIERAVSVTSEYYSPTGQQAPQSSPESADGARPSLEDSVPDTSTVDVHPHEGGNSIYEREKARIETIATLERRLRKLEAANEQLREERNVERAKRKAVEEEITEEKPKKRGVSRLLHWFLN